ncbi:hypothetical protein Lal_00032738 [Lupinus albus]|uniref:Protein TIC 20 n=1 Tax=Lupinus albus TaxID=3870 RepID=A0A6A5PJK7_LUPAL|nr:putative chloroplast protein import component Tic20 [Lupinus albus]KAF1897976.1 hypothetical protein Lal_00032738 [Lupinus albus]
MASIPLLRHSFRPTATTFFHPKPSSTTPLSFSPIQTPLTTTTPLRNAAVLTRLFKNHSSSSPPATDRLISVAAYCLPFFNSLQYSRFLLSQYPNLSLLFEPIIPFLSLYRSIPYASFVAFFALYLGLVRNPNVNRYVRFNAMQAVTLDVLLVLPVLMQRIFSPGRVGLGFKVMVWSHNFIFLFAVLCFFYSAGSCVFGRTPYLPFVADAASRQI